MNRIERLRNACSFIQTIIDEEAGGNKELIANLLDRGKKGIEVTWVRGKILRRIRTEVWEHHKEGVIHSKEVPGGTGWRPLGYLPIAMILGGDHSAWVKMARSLAIKEQK